MPDTTPRATFGTRIAYRDTNAAVRHLEICLTNATPDSVKWQAAHDRLTALKNPAAR